MCHEYDTFMRRNEFNLFLNIHLPESLILYIWPVYLGNNTMGDMLFNQVIC